MGAASVNQREERTGRRVIVLVLVAAMATAGIYGTWLSSRSAGAGAALAQTQQQTLPLGGEEGPSVTVVVDAITYTPGTPVEITLRDLILPSQDDAGEAEADDAGEAEDADPGAQLTISVQGGSGPLEGTGFEIDEISSEARLDLADDERDADSPPRLIVTPDPDGQKDLVVEVRLTSSDAESDGTLTVMPIVKILREDTVLGAEPEGSTGSTRSKSVQHSLTVVANADIAAITITETRNDPDRDAPVGAIRDMAEGTVESQSSVVWELEDLEAGTSKELQYVVDYRFSENSGSVAVQAEATASLADRTVARAAVLETVELPELELTTAVPAASQDGQSVLSGSKVTVVVTVHNVGPAAAHGLRIAVAPAEPPAASILPGSLDPKTQSDEAVWSGISIEAGKEKVFSFEEKLDDEIDGEASITHRVTVGYGDDEQAAVGGAVTFSVDSGATTSTSRGVEGGQLFVLVLIYILIAFFSFFVILILRGEEGLRGWAGVEIFTVINLLAGLLILALGSELPEEGALSLLAAIAGYVLGRNIGNDAKPPEPVVPPEPQTTVPAGGEGAAATPAESRLTRMSTRVSSSEGRPMRNALYVLSLVLVLVILAIVWLVDVATDANVSPETYAATTVVASLIVVMFGVLFVVTAHTTNESSRREDADGSTRDGSSVGSSAQDDARQADAGAEDADRSTRDAGAESTPPDDNTDQ